MEVQAQNGEMQLFAQKKLTVTSTDDVLFAGKKRVTLIGGGSYLRLEAGRIEYGTAGNYIRRAPRTFFAKRNEINVKMPVMPLAEGYSEYFIIQDQETGKPLKDFPYTLSVHGVDVNGKTDARGCTQYGWTAQSEDIVLTPYPEQFERMILDAKYWDEAEPLKLDFAEAQDTGNSGEQ